MKRSLIVVFLLMVMVAPVAEAEVYDKSNISKARSQPRFLTGPSGVVWEPPFSTAFDEEVIAQKINVFSIKPTWGISDLRDIADTGGNGFVSDTNGIIKVGTKDGANDTAVLKTSESGQYQAGAMGEAGIGLHVLDAPDTNQELRWGYMCPCSGDVKGNGYGFGQNDTGVFVFVKRNDNFTRIYQDDWNRDVLDGSGGDSNASNIDLDTINGQIYQIRFTWYGYGDAKFYVNALDEDGERINVLVHVEDFQDQTSVVDPNQPISVVAKNNGTADSMEVEVGGRQFSILSGRQRPQQRPVNEFVSQHEITGGVDEWEPLIAVKPRETFPVESNLRNSVRFQFVTVDITVEDAPVQFKVTLSDTTDATFSDVTEWDKESAAVTAKLSNLNSASSGEPFLRGFGFASSGQGNNPGTQSASRATETVTLGTDQQFVFWARNETADNATVSAVMKWNEQW